MTTLTEAEKRDALEAFEKFANVPTLPHIRNGVRNVWLAAWSASRAALGASNTKFKVGATYGDALEGHWFYLVPADEYAKQALIDGGYLPSPPKAKP